MSSDAASMGLIGGTLIMFLLFGVAAGLTQLRRPRPGAALELALRGALDAEQALTAALKAELEAKGLLIEALQRLAAERLRMVEAQNEYIRQLFARIEFMEAAMKPSANPAEPTH